MPLLSRGRIHPEERRPEGRNLPQILDAVGAPISGARLDSDLNSAPDSTPGSELDAAIERSFARRFGRNLSPALNRGSDQGFEPERPAPRSRLFETCANPRCGSGWLKLWRSRRAPVFEGGWCCSPECMRAQVESALSREFDTRSPAAQVRPHRIPLGLVLLEQGWITRDQLRAALEAQKAAGEGRLGAWLVRRQAASEEQVARALALQWSCPVLGLEFHRPEAMAALLPRLFVEALGALPLRVAAGRILYLGFEDRPDPALAFALERVTGLRVESGVVSAAHFRPARARLLAARYPRSGLVEAANGASLATCILKAVEQARPADARLVRVHGCLWLRLWLRPQLGPTPQPDAIEDLVFSLAGP